MSSGTEADVFGISAIAYHEPEIRKTVRELAAEGRLVSEPEALEELGFKHCLMSERPSTDVAADVIGDVLRQAELEPADVELVVNASALATSSLVPPGYLGPQNPDTEHLQQFFYSTGRIQDELGLVNAQTIGLSEQSCSSLMGAVWLARALMIQDGLNTAVCVNADVFPQGYKREVIYNIVSDSACAVVLRRGETRNQVLMYHHMTKGYYWDCDRRQNEMIASYFTTGKRVVRNTLRRAQVKLADVKMIIPHNVSYRSWDILSRLIDFPIDRIYTGNIAERGHSIAADNFLNLKDCLSEKRLQSGDLALLYSFGLGAHWGCSLLRV